MPTLCAHMHYKHQRMVELFEGKYKNTSVYKNILLFFNSFGEDKLERFVLKSLLCRNLMQSFLII